MKILTIILALLLAGCSVVQDTRQTVKDISANINTGHLMFEQLEINQEINAVFSDREWATVMTAKSIYKYTTKQISTFRDHEFGDAKLNNIYKSYNRWKNAYSEMDNVIMGKVDRLDVNPRRIYLEWRREQSDMQISVDSLVEDHQLTAQAAAVIFKGLGLGVRVYETVAKIK